MASEVIATMSIKTVWSGLNHNTSTTADLHRLLVYGFFLTPNLPELLQNLIKETKSSPVL